MFPWKDWQWLLLKPKHVVVGLKKIYICCVHQLYLLVFLEQLTEAVVNLI